MEQFTVFVLLFSLFALICKSENTTVNDQNIQEENHEQRIRNLEDNYLSLVSQAMATEVMMTNMQKTFNIQLKKIEDKYMSEANVKCQQFQLKLQEMENILKSHDHTTTAKNSTKKIIISGVVIMAGGETTGGRSSSVTTFDPSHPDAPTCSLPSLPSGRAGLTLDLLHNTLVVCGGTGGEKSCLVLNEGGKQWEEFSTLAHKRVVHYSWVTKKGLLLLGGRYGEDTAELVPSAPGHAVATYSLPRKVRESCTVDVELDGDMALVVTGGLYTRDQAYILDTEFAITQDLPRLKVGRRYHGCGYYESSGHKTFVVSGGYDSSDTYLFSSTEVLMKGGTWTLTENSLPSARTFMTTASLDNSIFGVGGYVGDGQTKNEIVKYNKGTNNWEAAGTLAEAKVGVGLATSTNFKC